MTTQKPQPTLVTIEFTETVERRVTFALTDAQRLAMEEHGYRPEHPVDVQTYFLFYTDSDTLLDHWSVSGEKEEHVTERLVDKVIVQEAAHA